MKSAVKRIKGILLALMYVAVNIVISVAIYLAYDLWHAASGRLSVTEIEKSATDNLFALTIIISIVSVWAYLLICRFRKKDISEYIKTKKVRLWLQKNINFQRILAIFFYFWYNKSKTVKGDANDSYLLP